MVRSICSVPGCEKPVVSNRLCNMHRQRYARHGSVDAGRPPSWGTKGKHPLHERWKSMCRLARTNIDPRWKNFWNFVADVGAVPSGRHRLYKRDAGLPYGPDNMEWRETLLPGRSNFKDRDAKNAYMRAYHAKVPLVFKDKYLKRYYGISLATYNELFDYQGGACAICRQPEVNLHYKSGEPMLLSVDHDHLTGQIRALLCTSCNTGIGCLKHDPALVERALRYLESHAESCDLVP